MDIYYFYNGIQNIINVALRNDAYLLNYEKIIQDPLIFLDFDKSNTCIKGGGTATATAATATAAANTNKKSDKKNNGNGNGKDNNEIDDKIAELKQAMKQKNDECKAIYDVNNKTNTNKKSLKIGSIDLPVNELSNALSILKSDNSVSKYRLKMDCDKEILVMNEKIEELETQKKAAGAEEEEEEEEEESEIEDSDDDDSGGQVMESIKMIIKFIVFISLLTIIPLAPFIAISYYSFKKLKLYYDERMLTL